MTCTKERKNVTFVKLNSTSFSPVLKKLVKYRNNIYFGKTNKQKQQVAYFDHDVVVAVHLQVPHVLICEFAAIYKKNIKNHDLFYSGATQGEILYTYFVKKLLIVDYGNFFSENVLFVCPTVHKICFYLYTVCTTTMHSQKVKNRYFQEKMCNMLGYQIKD